MVLLVIKSDNCFGQ